jgi:subtilisin
VVDSGVDPNEVPVVGGHNLVEGELNIDHGDNGTGHGTHVAGIIAHLQAGAPPALAPSAEIFSYRVAGAGSKRVDGYWVSFGVVQAAKDGCHLVNLSVSCPGYDEVLRRTDVHALENGMVLFGAAGNGWGATVTIPASLPNTFAVTALGRDGTYPNGSLEDGFVGPRPQVGPPDFLAAFSNTSPSNTVRLIAPGVGILSVRPGGGYGPLSGTSQACAVATAAAARALTNTTWLTHPADSARATAMKNHLLGAAKSIGLSLDYEGAGILGSSTQASQVSPAATAVAEVPRRRRLPRRFQL